MTTILDTLLGEFLEPLNGQDEHSLNEVKGSRYWSSELRKLEKRLFSDIPEYDDDDPTYIDLVDDIKKLFDNLDKKINEI